MGLWRKKGQAFGVATPVSNRYIDANGNLVINSSSFKIDQADKTNYDHMNAAAEAIGSTSVLLARISDTSKKRLDIVNDAIVAANRTQQSQQTEQRATPPYTLSNNDIDTSRRELVLSSVGSVPSNVVSDSIKMLENANRSISNANRTRLPANMYVPVISNVHVDLDERYGAVDLFYADVTVQVFTRGGKLPSGIRLFRAQMSDPKFSRPIHILSKVGSERIASSRGIKNKDVGMNSLVLSDSGVENAISKISYYDNNTGKRVIVDSDTLEIPKTAQDIIIDANVSDPRVPEALSHLDESILRNITAVNNIQKNPVYGFYHEPVVPGVLTNVEKIPGMSDTHVSSLNSTNTVRDGSMVSVESNSLKFQEIALISLNDKSVKNNGDWYEVTITDESVVYGRGYMYYATTIDENVIDSTRSKIVSVTVEGMRIPERPESVTVVVDDRKITLTIRVKDELVEKFEVYRLENSINRSTVVDTTSLFNDDGTDVKGVTNSINKNNYILIGECINEINNGSVFKDEKIMQGRSYIYRVYSVDVFGNKSESPYELSVFVPDVDSRGVNLKPPAIFCEPDQTSRGIRVVYKSDDENVKVLRVERIDRSLGRSRFADPESPRRLILGKPKRGMNGPTYIGEVQRSDKSMSKVITMKPGSNSIYGLFVDHDVLTDHVYQYRVYGIDSFGNETWTVFSDYVRVPFAKKIDPPVNVRATQVFDANGSVKGIKLLWDDGNLNIPAEDLVGNQTDLENSKVRSLYQIKRRKVGEHNWQYFQLITATEFTDDVSSDVAPNYRPSFLEKDTFYEYCVQTVRKEGYSSNFSNIVKIDTYGVLFNPIDFTLKIPDVSVSPFFVMLNWDTIKSSAPVDYWLIERAVINNFSASKMNMSNPLAFSKIRYEKFRKVTRESSRFSSVAADKNNKESVSDVIVGEHNYMDTMVDFGNTYFYRICAVSVTGKVSSWEYKAIKLTSENFERTVTNIISNDVAKELGTVQQPIIIPFGWMPPSSAMRMVPGYALPWGRRPNYENKYDVVERNK